MSRSRNRSQAPAVPAPVPHAGGLAGLPLPVLAGFGLSLALLMAHAHHYMFLTDDAFISFRYARNFAHGHGLVFNPGFERVEGYSNFLWVMLLSAFDALGLAPESAAMPLSLVATVLLWLVVVAFAARRRTGRNSDWTLLVPAFALAVTRSFAVWSTSGLETRVFELLLVAGLLRMVTEIEATVRGEARLPLASWLLALAALTRPEGLLLAGWAFVVAGAWLARHAPKSLGQFARRALPFVILVAAHFIFRRVYYGDWLPNTYYAKFGGHASWSSGVRYLAAFALEYGVVLWMPLLAAGVLMNVRRGSPLLLWVMAGVLPYLAYVAAIGGDHFEYRMLDLVFPLAFVLIHDGVRAWVEERRSAVIMALAITALGLGLTVIPLASSRGFPVGYQDGFPGAQLGRSAAADSWLSPDNDPVLRLPGFRQVATIHRDLLRGLTLHYVGLRQEEHAAFLASVLPEARALARLRTRGVLPESLYVAMDCVGAIPYYSGLRTLDRLGLTDALIARSPSNRALLAHGKGATLENARERGVDLWAIDQVHLMMPLTSNRMLTTLKDASSGVSQFEAIDGGDEGTLFVEFPLGVEATRARFPGLPIRSSSDTSFLHPLMRRARLAYEAQLAADPGDAAAERNLGYLMILVEDYPAARQHYLTMCRRAPGYREAFELLSLCDLALGDRREAALAAERAIELAQGEGDAAAVERIRARLAEAR